MAGGAWESRAGGGQILSRDWGPGWASNAWGSDAMGGQGHSLGSQMQGVEWPLPRSLGSMGQGLHGDQVKKGHVLFGIQVLVVSVG